MVCTKMCLDVCSSYKPKMVECTFLAAVEWQLRGASTTTSRNTVIVTFPGQATSWTYLASYLCCHLVELLSSVMTGVYTCLPLLIRLFCETDEQCQALLTNLCLVAPKQLQSQTVVVVVVCIRSHNWSARQWHHRLQSVVWTSHRVVLSVGRIRQCVTSFGSHRRNTDRSLKVSIFLQAPQWPCPVWKLETVQERPLLSRESKSRLSDCGVVHEVCIDHRGRLPGFSPLTVTVQTVPDTLSCTAVSILLRLPSTFISLWIFSKLKVRSQSQCSFKKCFQRTQLSRCCLLYTSPSPRD